MKNFLLFLGIILCYFLLNYIDKSFIATDSKIFDFLSKDYPSAVVQNYMDSQKKWWWVSYAITPLLIGIKVLLVAFCLNFLKIIDENADNIKYSDFVFISLIAEFVFIIAGLYKFVYFYWLQTDYTLEDLQTYYPMSLINFREYISTEKWLAYPLQLVNLFEVFYWIVLVVGVRGLFGDNISHRRTTGYVALTYGTGLLFWTGIVCFLILNAQY
ncbi:MAG: hypothetical protein Q4G16_04770 [Cruoricaptor ignavus]|nr:hypothetical protein [Cruoricaptor ignavus]